MGRDGEGKIWRNVDLFDLYIWSVSIKLQSQWLTSRMAKSPALARESFYFFPFFYPSLLEAMQSFIKAEGIRLLWIPTKHYSCSCQESCWPCTGIGASVLSHVLQRELGQQLCAVTLLPAKAITSLWAAFCALAWAERGLSPQGIILMASKCALLPQFWLWNTGNYPGHESGLSQTPFFTRQLRSFTYRCSRELLLFTFFYLFVHLEHLT